MDNGLKETDELNNTMIRILKRAKIQEAETNFPVVIPVIKFGLLKPLCTDPAAYEIKFEIIEHTATFTGRVRITGIVKNIGSMAFSGGGGMAYLYENKTLRATKLFGYIASRAAISLNYVRSWYASSPNEGEFPPMYKLLIQYDSDILKDGNKNNDDCKVNNNKKEKSGSGINDFFR